MKVNGLQQVEYKFIGLKSFDGLADSFLLAVGDRIKENALRRMAVVSGEMTKNAKCEKTGVGKVTISVNVPYAAYNHEGKRVDGSRVIKKRTPPGQKYFLKKAAIQTVPQNRLDIHFITDKIKKHL